MAAVPVLSYSGVRSYLECPLRWKFLYIDRLPEAPRGYFSFGRTLHSVLEELARPLVVPFPRRKGDATMQHTLDHFAGAPGTAGAPRGGVSPMDREAVRAAYARLWVSEGYPSPEEEARYRALGEEILLKFYDAFVATPPQPVAVEEHLEAQWDGIPIHGYVDRIDRSPTGGLEILDYKTTRNLTRADAVGSDQLSFYQALVEKNYPAPVESLALFDLRGGSELRVPRRSPRELAMLQDRVAKVADGIGAEAFHPTPGRQCGRCEFRPLCPEFREVPAEERARLGGLVDRFQELREEERRLDRELRSTAEELHRQAERLGVYRVPGSRTVAHRQRETRRSYPAERLRPILEAEHLLDRVSAPDPGLVERLAGDPAVSRAVRRKISAAGTRSEAWYWDLEDGPPASPRNG